MASRPEGASGDVARAMVWSAIEENAILDTMMLLTVNAGSSSLRLAAYSVSGGEPEAIASARYELQGASVAELLRNFLAQYQPGHITAVVHRIVHGGPHFSGPSLIDAASEQQLAQLTPLAPLHTGRSLSLIRAARALFSADTPHIASFDTAFYSGLPPFARHYALPAELTTRLGLRRYGFHGLAHEALWQRWSAVAARGASTGRILTLQLGSGCSITATRDGRPVDTSMGFTPLEGLMMATRSGDIDPGLLLYLQQHHGWSTGDLDDLLNRQSGLLGVSGLSADMRVLLASDSAAAKLAVGLYCYRVRKYVGAYLAVLGGADSIVFGGGVGENAPEVRARILSDMDWAGVHIDPTANSATTGHERRISNLQSPVSVWVLKADEQALMARQAATLLAAQATH
ncbi:acetate/propionate family kinase [Haliea sp.]|uniref:acetate/propionate family kinase n=1 Tax=Haliea sp. TaxID=1932666 RepID=UPI003527CB2D